MTTVIPICIWCSRYRKDVTCNAFPDGIPAAIIRSEVDHRQPVKGDHGLRFDPENEQAAQAAADLLRARPAGGNR